MSVEELGEIDALLAQATFPSVKTALNNLRRRLQPPSPPVTFSTAVPSAGKAGDSNSESSYISINDFAWDQGEYNSPTVTLYIELEGVGSVKDNVKCEFKSDSFDLTVHGLNGKNYRLVKDNLDKDIVPEDCKFIVKKDKVVVKLAKKKGEYSFEQWQSLTSKKSKEKKEATKKDPSAGIMDMMKDMYEDGDDNMKRVIGEAMMKAQRGEKSDPPDMGGMGGMGGL